MKYSKEFISSLIQQSTKEKMPIKNLCKINHISYKTFCKYKKLYNFEYFSPGKNPGSRTKFNEYSCNDNYFSIPTEENSYWAGFIAADGNIHKRTLSFGLKHSDIQQIELFKSHIQSESPIKTYNTKLNDKIFKFSSIAINSEKICSDLLRNFNITKNKSLTLEPPPLNDSCLDYYIKGYICGDGCISIYNNRRYDKMRLSILGTYNVLMCIKNRISEIIQMDVGSLYKIKNIYNLSYSSKTARTIFLHYYGLKYGLPRKWSYEKFLFCKNWKDGRTEKGEERRRLVFDLSKTKSNYEIAEILNCTYQNVYIIKNTQRYKDIEDQQNEVV